METETSTDTLTSCSPIYQCYNCGEDGRTGTVLIYLPCDDVFCIVCVQNMHQVAGTKPPGSGHSCPACHEVNYVPEGGLYNFRQICNIRRDSDQWQTYRKRGQDTGNQYPVGSCVRCRVPCQPWFSTMYENKLVNFCFCYYCSLQLTQYLTQRRGHQHSVDHPMNQYAAKLGNRLSSHTWNALRAVHYVMR